MPTGRQCSEPLSARKASDAWRSEPMISSGRAPEGAMPLCSVTVRQPARTAPMKISAISGCNSSTERGNDGTRCISKAAVVSKAPSRMPSESWRSSGMPA